MKKVLFFLSIVTLIVVFIGVKPQLIIQKKITVEQKIVLPNSPGKFISYRLDQKTTALTLLQQTAKVMTNGEGVNAFVIDINGKQALTKNKEFWGFYVNSKPAEVGAGSYLLQNNDKIVWQIDHY